MKAVEKFFEKYRQSDKRKIQDETAFKKFLDKIESFGLPPRPFGIAQRKGNRCDINIK